MQYVLIASLAAFGLVVVAFLVYGSRLPAKWEVISSTTVKAERERLFDYLNEIRNWEQWTIWSKDVNPDFQFTYEGPPQGTGATQCWKARAQHGKTKLCSAQRPEKIAYMFQFGHGQHMLKGCITLLPRGSETEVVWAAYGDAGGNPSRKIMARMMVPYMRRDFERGLLRLKHLMEQEKIA